MKRSNTFREMFHILFCIFLLSTAFMVNASASSAASMKVDIVSYEPFPARIGEHVDVWVKIENTGYGRADAVSIKMEPEYPFILDSQNNAIRNIGIMSPETESLQRFRLFVDENARVGTGSVDVYYRTNNEDIWYRSSFDLNVGSNTFNSKGTLELTDIECRPRVLMPVDVATLNFVLTNTADKDVVTIAGVDFDTNARVQSALLKGTEGIEVISDIYTGSGVIGPGDSIILSYNIRIDNDIAKGTHHLELFMTGNSHAYNNNWRIPVDVDPTSLKVIPIKTMELVNGEGQLEFEVANTHPNTLNSVSVKLEAENVVFSPEEYFIGSMGPDELFTIEIDAKSSSQDLSVPVTISVEYRNGMNQHSTELGIRDMQLIEANNGNNRSTIALGAALVILLGIPAVAYMRRRKNSN